MHPIFESYREYVAKCVTENTEPKLLSEFTGSNDALEVEDEMPVFDGNGVIEGARRVLVYIRDRQGVCPLGDGHRRLALLRDAAHLRGA